MEQLKLEEQTEEQPTYDLGTAPPVADHEDPSYDLGNEAEGEAPSLAIAPLAFRLRVRLLVILPCGFLVDRSPLGYLI